jgi:hypothetical protein
MKINIFVPVKSGGKFTDYTFTHSSVSGEKTNGPQAPEDEIITAIDESRMSPEKRIARRFLVFLGNHRLTLTELLKLPIREQNRLRKEFID